MARGKHSGESRFFGDDDYTGRRRRRSESDSYEESTEEENVYKNNYKNIICQQIDYILYIQTLKLDFVLLLLF